MTTVDTQRPVRRPTLAGARDRSSSPRVALRLGGSGARDARSSRATADVRSRVDTLPIANALPLDLGIKKGFFEQQGIEIKKIDRSRAATTSCSRSRTRNGDDRLRRLGPGDDRSHERDPDHARSRASEVEGTSEATTGRTSSSRARARSGRRPTSRARRSRSTRSRASARSMIKAALEKSGVDPNSIKLLALPVPGDAGGAQQRPGRRDLDAGAVPVAGARTSTAPAS